MCEWFSVREGNARLPLPPMLMFDRITEIKSDNGKYKKGFIKAELDVKDNMWFSIVILRGSCDARMFGFGCYVAISWVLFDGKESLVKDVL